MAKIYNMAMLAQCAVQCPSASTPALSPLESAIFPERQDRPMRKAEGIDRPRQRDYLQEPFFFSFSRMGGS